MPLRHTAAVLAAGCLLAACDRHSATEIPESYGHGSSHQKSFTDHEVDSRLYTRSFSDTQGTAAEKVGGPDTAPPAASPTASAGGHFFPSGN